MEAHSTRRKTPMFTNRVEAKAETLMRQAGMTAEDYLRHAITAIDRVMGEDKAKRNPQLVAAFLHVCAADYATAILSQTLQESATDLGNAIEQALQNLVDSWPRSA